MSQNKFLKIAIVLLLVLNASTIIYMLRAGNRHHPPELGQYLMHELDFSPQQREQFEKLRDEHRALAGPWRKQNKELHDAFYDLVSTNAGDSAQVSLLSDSIAAVQKKIEVSMFYHFKNVYGLCDENQKKKFHQVIRGALKFMAPQPPPPKH